MGAPFDDFSWIAALWNAVYILAAFVLALPVGLNREAAHRLGLRTIPLVSVASCGFIMLAHTYDDPNAQARALQGIITGIGFLGGGAILKKDDAIHGTATAASIWTTAGIGAAVAYNRFEVAVLLALFNFIILVGLKPLGDKMDGTGKKDQADLSHSSDDEDE